MANTFEVPCAVFSSVATTVCFSETLNVTAEFSPIPCTSNVSTSSRTDMRVFMNSSFSIMLSAALLISKEDVSLSKFAMGSARMLFRVASSFLLRAPSFFCTSAELALSTLVAVPGVEGVVGPAAAIVKADPGRDAGGPEDVFLTGILKSGFHV